jgi:heptose I phosphotransferase
MTTHFQIEPAFAHALCAAGLDSFDALMAAPAAGPPTSAHADRETVPLEISIDGLPRRFFLKRASRVPFKRAVAPLFRGRRGRSQPLAEWNILGELSACGIGAMQRVAVGERRVAGRPVAACLLVQAVPAERTLADWLDPEGSRRGPLTPRQRARLLAAVGECVGHLTARGFSWPDCQAKHFFAAMQPDGRSWSLWLIDVERMTHDGDAPAPAADALVESAWDHLNRLRQSSVMARLTWRDYLHVAAGVHHALRRVVPVPKDERLRALDLCGSFTGHELLRPTVPDDQSAANGVRRVEDYKLDAAFAELFRARGLDSFDRIFNVPVDADLHKAGLSTHRSRGRFSLTDAAGRSHTFFIKRYDRPPMADQLRRIFSGSPVESLATREYRFIKRLNQIGIATPRCAAFGERMIGPIERQSFLVTAALDGVSLERYAADILHGEAPPPAPRLRQQIISQLAMITYTLHGARYVHRDLYFSHVFLHRNADGSVALRLIDLARMLARPRNAIRWIVKDLAALDYSAPRPIVTRADRLRFLIYYLDPLRDDRLGADLGTERTAWRRALRRPRSATARAAETHPRRYHIRLVAARVARMAAHDARRRRRHSPP